MQVAKVGHFGAMRAIPLHNVAIGAAGVAVAAAAYWYPHHVLHPITHALQYLRGHQRLASSPFPQQKNARKKIKKSRKIRVRAYQKASCSKYRKHGADETNDIVQTSVACTTAIAAAATVSVHNQRFIAEPFRQHFICIKTSNSIMNLIAVIILLQ
jgi:hypothetical protein